VLKEYTLFEPMRDKVQIAIDRLKMFEPAEGYYLAYSGGTGKGTADKEAMKKACEEKTGKKPQDDNEADAILLGIMAYEDYGVR